MKVGRAIWGTTPDIWILDIWPFLAKDIRYLADQTVSPVPEAFCSILFKFVWIGLLLFPICLYCREKPPSNHGANIPRQLLLNTPRGFPDAARRAVALSGHKNMVDAPGPHLHYPAHHHPAAEVYLILAGESLWRRGREGQVWTRRRPGDTVVHRPREEHEF